MPEAAAELLFQVIAGRAERAAVIVTTNLPFSEWTTMFPNTRLCKAMLDRLTDQADIRWARMVEGQEGLRHGEESVHIFLSDDRETVFQHALQIARRGEECHKEGRRWVETRLAGVVTLDSLGSNPIEFEVNLGSKKPTKHLAFEHVFDPEGSIPSPMF